MPKMIFVNLPVADLPAARAFYEAIGATNNAQFTDETAACMTFSDSIHVMILTHDKFSHFTPRPIADANAASEVLLCLSADSRESVDTAVERAVASGGTADPAPKQDSEEGQVKGFTGAGLPAGSKLWSKAGWTSNTRHDAALVEFPSGKKYILVTFTVNHASDATLIPFIAKTFTAGCE